MNDSNEIVRDSGSGDNEENKIDKSDDKQILFTGPIKSETRSSGPGGGLSENEASIYRAKLVEQRRLAKERKEEEQRR